MGTSFAPLELLGYAIFEVTYSELSLSVSIDLVYNLKFDIYTPCSGTVALIKIMNIPITMKVYS